MASDRDRNLTVVPLKREVNAQLVENLEHQLALARSGQLVSGGFFGTLHDDTVLTSCSTTSNTLVELAAVMRVAHRMQMRMDNSMGEIEVDVEPNDDD